MSRIEAVCPQCATAYTAADQHADRATCQNCGFTEPLPDEIVRVVEAGTTRQISPALEMPVCMADMIEPDLSAISPAALEQALGNLEPICAICGQPAVEKLVGITQEVAPFYDAHAAPTPVTLYVCAADYLEAQRAAPRWGETIPIVLTVGQLKVVEQS